jgi:N-acetylneuraminic acid mutarotase
MVIFGGFINSNEKVNDIYRYYIKENKWEKVLLLGGSEVPVPRSGHSAIIYKDSMIIFGGKDSDNNRLNDIWEFNFLTYTWRYFPTLDSPYPRSGHSACLYKDYMLVFGGIYEVTKELNDLLLFDIKTNRWITFFEETYSPIQKNFTIMNKI